MKIEKGSFEKDCIIVKEDMFITVEGADDFRNKLNDPEFFLDAIVFENYGELIFRKNGYFWCIDRQNIYVSVEVGRWKLVLKDVRWDYKTIVNQIAVAKMLETLVKDMK